MYLFDFLKKIVRKANIPILIYLLMNVFLITFALSLFFGGGKLPFWRTLPAGVLLYGISLAIALSPAGEWLLRLQTGCRRLEREDQIDRIEPLFRETYIRAKRLCPSLSEDIQLFISTDEEPNAFAAGRRTICVTKGLLKLPDKEIKAALGHEFGHLAHADTDLILIVSVGNLLVTGLILGLRLVIGLFHLALDLVSIFIGGPEGLVGALASALQHLLVTLLVGGLTWIWTRIGVLLVMKSSRENEYEADAFSMRLGFGEGLCSLLDHISPGSANGLFANLASSHPDTNSRIRRLQEMGCRTACAS